MTGDTEEKLNQRLSETERKILHSIKNLAELVTQLHDAETDAAGNYAATLKGQGNTAKKKIAFE